MNKIGANEGVTVVAKEGAPVIATEGVREIAAFVGKRVNKGLNGLDVGKAKITAASLATGKAMLAIASSSGKLDNSTHRH